MTASNDDFSPPPGKVPDWTPTNAEVYPGADLRETVLTGAEVLGTDLTDADLEDVVFSAPFPADLDF